MSGTRLRGGCLCGGVQYEISGELMRFYHCHCGRCRKATGTGHASNIMVKLGEAAWIKGEELLGHYKVPEAQRFSTCFCTRCGSQLPRVRKEMGFALIPAGSLDVEPGIKPQARIFWDSRAEWSCEGDGLPVFPEYPTQG
jgi:hypothetical protein